MLLTALLSILTIQLPSAHAQKYSDWSTPVNLGSVVNSASQDQQPAISKDGLSLYFTSNRPGGFGGFDMYVSQRASVDDAWGSPVNLGSNVNTSLNEGNPAFSRDGHAMFFQSDRPAGLAQETSGCRNVSTRTTTSTGSPLLTLLSELRAGRSGSNLFRE
jgi:hypothetical protein